MDYADLGGGTKLPVGPPQRDDSLKGPLQDIFNRIAEGLTTSGSVDVEDLRRRSALTEVEDETPVQHMYRFVAEGVRVSFRLSDLKRPLEGTKTVTQLVHSVYSGMNTHHMRLILDGKEVGPLDVVTCVASTAESTSGRWIQLHINPRGLRGGGADKSEDEIRGVLSSLLQSKGLQGKTCSRSWRRLFLGSLGRTSKAGPPKELGKH